MGDVVIPRDVVQELAAQPPDLVLEAEFHDKVLPVLDRSLLAAISQESLRVTLRQLCLARV